MPRSIRRPLLAVATAAALSLTSVLSAPLAASAGDPAGSGDGAGPTPQVIGGTVAATGQFPFAAAVIADGKAPRDGLWCGATVLSRSWVLTAGHCIVDWSGSSPRWRSPSSLDVLTGTTTLTSGGGQRIHVASIHRHPSYVPGRNDFDVALLRLARPTSSPEIAVIGSSAADQALDDTGVTAIAMGWGVVRYPSATAADSLRWVDLPILSSSTCQSSYPIGFGDEAGPLEYHASNMLCAGYLAGGKDTCSGDSGGGLVTEASDGSWRQVGVTSFGFRCAAAGYPGVYQRLAATSSWIGRERRFGPFAPDAVAYIAQQYRDFAGRSPSASELSRWRASLDRSPAADLIVAMQGSSAWDANAGMNVRLYRAAFGRDPDTSGLGFWVRQRWAGRGPVAIANHFASSSEFLRTYGALDDPAYVDRVYQNVFGRPADPSGRDYWIRKLAAGTGRGQVLYELSNSSEYRRKTDVRVRIITLRFGLLRVVPSPAEIAASEALSLRTLVDTLRTSYRYAARFNG